MATREIILLRHAHAENASPGQEDIGRALSVRGEAEADAAGAWLKQHAATPERVLCSPAARSRETCERVLAALGYTDMRNEPRIYEATPASLIRVLDDHADAGSVMLVGHNPVIEQALETLIGHQAIAQTLPNGFPPGGLAILDYNVGLNGWRLIDFMNG